SLRGRAGKTRAQDERVETHLELLDHVVTGLAGGALGLFVLDPHLLFTDSVLLPEPLLLAKPHGVVAVGLAPRTAVLAGRVRTRLHDAGRLGGQRDAERAREADLAAVLGL